MARNGKVGGSLYHKNPATCGCPYHTALRRPKETFTITTGAGRDALVSKKGKKTVINADLDPIYTQGRTARDRVIQWVALRAKEPGITNVEIADRMGIKACSLNNLISMANREGWLRFEDPMSRVEHELIPKVIDNLSMFLDEKDRTVTIETAKGTLFKQYQDSKGISEAPTTMLALKIETVEPSNSKIISSGNIVGKARELDE